MENVRKPFTISIVTDNGVDSTSKFQILPWIGVLSMVAYKALSLAREWIKGEKSSGKLIKTEIDEMLMELCYTGDNHISTVLNEFICEIMKEFVIRTEEEMKTIAELIGKGTKTLDELKVKEKELLNELGLSTYKQDILLARNGVECETFISSNKYPSSKSIEEEIQTIANWKVEKMSQVDQWKENKEKIVAAGTATEIENVAECYRTLDRRTEMKGREMAKLSGQKGDEHKKIAEYICIEKEEICDLIEKEKDSLVEWGIEKKKNLVEWKWTTEKERAERMSQEGKTINELIKRSVKERETLIQLLLKRKERNDKDRIEPEQNITTSHGTMTVVKKSITEELTLQEKYMFDESNRRYEETFAELNRKYEEMFVELNRRYDKTFDELKRKQDDMQDEREQKLKKTIAQLKGTVKIACDEMITIS